ncbi:DNA topoisomerase 2, partial [Perkinsus olseni]
ASDDRTVDITELPVKTWTQNYKEFLQEMMQAGQEAITQEKKAKAKAKRRAAAAASSDAGSEPSTPPAAASGEKDKEKKKGPAVKLGDLKEYHTEHSVHFKCTLQNEAAKSVVDSLGLEKAFKLRSAFSTTNMVLFDRNGKIRRYDSVLDIIKDFADLRLDMYVLRKESLIAKLTKEILILSNKCRFVTMVVNGEIVFQKKKIVQLMEELKRKKFMTMMEIDAQTKAAKTTSLKGKMASSTSGATGDEVKSEGESSDEEADDEAKAEKQQKRSGYDYLLAMSMWSLTLERVEAMERLLRDKEADLKVLRGRTIEEMWDRDLVQLLAALDEDDDRRAKEIKAEARYRKNKPK